MESGIKGSIAGSKLRDALGGLTPSPKPSQPKAGRFGKCGKMIIKPYSIPDADREKLLKTFFRFVTPSICGCWEWQGRIHNGYPSCPTPSGNTKWAHRVSYALFNGPIKEGMHIDHNCRNRTCVNPAHLEQMTPTKNIQAIYSRRWKDHRRLMEEKGQLSLW